MKRIGEVTVSTYADPVGDEYIEIESCGESISVLRSEAGALAAALVIEANESVEQGESVQ